MVNIPLNTKMQGFKPQYVSIELSEENGTKFHFAAMLDVEENEDENQPDNIALYFSQTIAAFVMTKEEALILAADITNWANGNYMRRKDVGSNEYERVQYFIKKLKLVK
jgi:hypothetical protein